MAGLFLSSCEQPVNDPLADSEAVTRADSTVNDSTANLGISITMPDTAWQVFHRGSF